MCLDRIGIPAFKTTDRCLPSVQGTVINHPKNPVCRAIWFLTHDKINQVSTAINPVTVSAQTKDFGLPNIPGCHVSQGPHSFTAVFDMTIVSRSRCSCRRQSTARLDAGLLIRADYKITPAQGLSFPDSLIQIQNPCSLLLEGRILQPNPDSVAPGSGGILTQPEPNSLAADRCNDSLLFCLPSNFVMGKPEKGQSKLFGQLARKRLNSDNNLKGKKRQTFPGAVFPVDRPIVGQRNAFSI